MADDEHNDNIEPDLLDEYRRHFIGDMPDEMRDELAAELDMTRPEIDAFIDKMAKAWEALDPEPYGGHK